MPHNTPISYRSCVEAVLLLSFSATRDSCLQVDLKACANVLRLQGQPFSCVLMEVYDDELERRCLLIPPSIHPLEKEKKAVP